MVRLRTRDPALADEISGFEKILERFLGAFEEPGALGRRPDDLEDVLARLALAGPGVCAMRALRRQAPSLALSDASLLNAAAAVAEGFRAQFNVPEAVGLLKAKSGGDDYWKRVLAYGIEGNLQAVLDEHLHVLRDALGLFDAEPVEMVGKLAEDLAATVAPRPANLLAHQYRVDRPTQMLTRSKDLRIRTRFALRFGDIRDEEQGLQRADLVRRAFNSPFRPFVLASTSVGQEGLDFHTWCHRIVHWNVPTNPVDMEQREGRVHRFKGLAVRRNVARRFGLAALRDTETSDPWDQLFAFAREQRGDDQNDLVPYWIFDNVENPVRVQRYVPIPPLSKEAERYEQLKKALVLYRLAFGQPRQEDLVAWLAEASDAASLDMLGGWQIDLRPPTSYRRSDAKEDQKVRDAETA